MKRGIVFGFTTLVLTLAQAVGVEQMAITSSSSTVGRAPASAFAPNEELIPTPVERKTWLSEIMVEDTAGVMKGVRLQLNEWQEREEYAERWNLTDSGIVDLPERNEKQKLITKNILKYVDKRISGEIKNAEEGSTFYKVGKVQEALKPESEVGVSQNFKLKFKARVLQQMAMMKMVNPYVDSTAEVKLNGRVNLHIKREFASVGVKTQMLVKVTEGDMDLRCEKDLKELGAVAFVEYSGLDNEYIAAVDKPLAPNLVGRISSTQHPSDLAFTGKSDNRLEFFYSSAF